LGQGGYDALEPAFVGFKGFDLITKSVEFAGLPLFVFAAGVVGVGYLLKLIL